MVIEAFRKKRKLDLILTGRQLLRVFSGKTVSALPDKRTRKRNVFCEWIGLRRAGYLTLFVDECSRHDCRAESNSEDAIWKLREA